MGQRHFLVACQTSQDRLKCQLFLTASATFPPALIGYR